MDYNPRFNLLQITRHKEKWIMTQFQQKYKEEKKDESKYFFTQKMNSITFKKFNSIEP